VNSMPKQVLIFATSNFHKFEEVNQIFSRFTSLRLRQLDLELPELQSLDLAKIAIFALKSLLEATRDDIDSHPTFVEDSGLFIHALKGFPGPYSSFSYKTLGLEGILTLMREIPDREAYFQSTIAFKFGSTIRVFHGRTEGKISHAASQSGWGYDPVFIPNNSGSQTYSDLGEQKQFISHRYLATKQLIEFLQDNYIARKDLNP